MYKAKRSFCLIVGFMLVFVFTSCVSNNVEPVTDATETTLTTTAATQTSKETDKPVVTTTTKTVETTTEKNPLEETYEITWLRIYTQSWEEGRWDELELEEKFNVDLKVWSIYFSPSDLSQVDMMLAAGDCPDFGYYYKDTRSLIEQDIARTLPKKLIDQFLPSYSAILNNDPIGWQYNKVVETDPFYKADSVDYYGLTMLTPMFNVTRNLACWRLDWLENLGYNFSDLVELPVDYSKMAAYAGESVKEGLGKVYITNYVFNFDEVNDIYQDFTEEDPDGNGD